MRTVVYMFVAGILAGIVIGAVGHSWFDHRAGLTAGQQLTDQAKQIAELKGQVIAMVPEKGLVQNVVEVLPSGVPWLMLNEVAVDMDGKRHRFLVGELDRDWPGYVSAYLGNGLYGNTRIVVNPGR